MQDYAIVCNYLSYLTIYSGLKIVTSALLRKRTFSYK